MSNGALPFAGKEPRFGSREDGGGDVVGCEAPEARGPSEVGGALLGPREGVHASPEPGTSAAVKLWGTGGMQGATVRLRGMIQVRRG